MGRGVFLSHSSADGAGAGALRQALVSRLGPQGLGHRVLLDEQELKPGDAWRPKLYRWLGECDGAVLFLTPEALVSPWVRKEATILSWRRALRACHGQEMRVVPVLLDGVTPEDVGAAFPAVYLDESQFLRAEVHDAADAAEVADVIAARFPAHLAESDDPLQRWAADVGAWLGRVDEHFLEQVAKELSVDDAWVVDGSWELEARCLNLADSLIHAPFAEVAAALRTIVRSGAATKDRLVHTLVLTCVPADSAGAVLSAMLHRTERVVAVNARYTETAERLVRRATCDGPVLTVPPPAPVVTERPEELHAMIRSAIGSAVRFRPGEFRAEDLQYLDEPLVLLLRARAEPAGPDDDAVDGLEPAVLRDVLGWLRTELSQVVVVVLTGAVAPDEPSDLGERLGVGCVHVVRPPLDCEEERRSDAAIGRLLAQLRQRWLEEGA